MKIGVILKPTVCNAAYRALAPMLMLGAQGHEIVWAKPTPGWRFPLRELLVCDVVHIYRCLDEPSVMKGVQELRRRNVPLTWDDDDDLRLVPPATPGYKEHYGGINRERGTRQQTAMLSKVDLVTTTTPALADLFRTRFDGPIEIIENYLESDQYASGRRGRDGVTIGWVACLEHTADVEQLGLTATLRNVLARDERIRITTVGVQLDLDSSRYTHVKRVQFPDLPQFLAGLDIGIAPIADHPMSYARSNVKVKEYAAAGVPWVASTRGQYAELGAKAGGITVADDGWEQALLDLAGSRLKRMRLRRNAESWARSQHLRRHVGRWEAALRTAMEVADRRAA